MSSTHRALSSFSLIKTAQRKETNGQSLRGGPTTTTRGKNKKTSFLFQEISEKRILRALLKFFWLCVVASTIAWLHSCRLFVCCFFFDFLFSAPHSQEVSSMFFRGWFWPWTAYTRWCSWFFLRKRISCDWSKWTSTSTSLHLRRRFLLYLLCALPTEVKLWLENFKQRIFFSQKEIISAEVFHSSAHRSTCWGKSVCG